MKIETAKSSSPNQASATACADSHGEENNFKHRQLWPSNVTLCPWRRLALLAVLLVWVIALGLSPILAIISLYFGAAGLWLLALLRAAKRKS